MMDFGGSIHIFDGMAALTEQQLSGGYSVVDVALGAL